MRTTDSDSAPAEDGDDTTRAASEEGSGTATAPAATAKEPEGSEEKDKERSGRLSFLHELPVLLLIALVLALLIKTFLIQAFFIPSESMEPTFVRGDRVLVNKVVYHIHPPRRGDIIVFEDPHPVAVHRNPLQVFWHWLTSGLGGGSSQDKDFIKRVIALPGETVEVHQGIVYIDGQAIDEPYLDPEGDRSNYDPHRVPENHVFVMGDNRAHSADSRTLLGYIPYGRILGRAFVIIWPPSRAKVLHRPRYEPGSAFPVVAIAGLALCRRRGRYRVQPWVDTAWVRPVARRRIGSTSVEVKA